MLSGQVFARQGLLSLLCFSIAVPLLSHLTACHKCRPLACVEWPGATPIQASRLQADYEADDVPHEVGAESRDRHFETPSCFVYTYAHVAIVHNNSYLLQPPGPEHQAVVIARDGES